MNRTKIEWADWTWNAITGCLHGCWYCYAKKLFTRFHKSFIPTFYEERLKEPYELKIPTERSNRSRKSWISATFPHNWLIFACSVSDLFAQWTPNRWREKVLKVTEENPMHIFQLLTKNPERIPLTYRFPDNVWVGATVTNMGADECNIEAIKKVRAMVKFVSFEPLLNPLKEQVSLKGVDWIIIGKLTGSNRVKLDPQWVDDIMARADALGIPVFMKNNLFQTTIKTLDGTLDVRKKRQEFPLWEG